MYSKELIDEIKNTYPHETLLHKMSDRGEEYVGRCLNDLAPASISIDIILTATSLNELQLIAMDYKRKIDLYEKWCEEFLNTKDKKNENNK